MDEMRTSSKTRMGRTGISMLVRRMKMMEKEMMGRKMGEEVVQYGHAVHKNRL